MDLKKGSNKMKSKLLNDKINCSELVLVSGAPLFHVMKSVLLLPVLGFGGLEV